MIENSICQYINIREKDNLSFDAIWSEKIHEIITKNLNIEVLSYVCYNINTHLILNNMPRMGCIHLAR